MFKGQYMKKAALILLSIIFLSGCDNPHYGKSLVYKADLERLERYGISPAATIQDGLHQLLDKLDTASQASAQQNRATLTWVMETTAEKYTAPDFCGLFGKKLDIKYTNEYGNQEYRGELNSLSKDWLVLGNWQAIDYSKIISVEVMQ